MAKNNKSSKISGKSTRAGIDDRPVTTMLPQSRVSSPLEPRLNFPGLVTTLAANYNVINIRFIRSIVPIIRGLISLNPNMDQALDNVVTLANTGHKVYFDRNVTPDQVDLMRNHLENKRKYWATGAAGMDGIINKMFRQLMIGGAVSVEWVPNTSLTGIENCAFVNPEDIEFVLNDRATKYDPYQIVRNSIIGQDVEMTNGNLRKLNTETYQYFALNGDTELPFGIPPYLSALGAVDTQNRMKRNINFVVDTMGLVGFLEVLLDKPPQTGKLQKDSAYEAYLNATLVEAKDRVLNSVKEGVVVGYKDDHEFKFNSANKSYAGVTELFQENELQFFSALKQDGALAGRGYSTSETQINVVFIKLLSQLKNLQNIVKTPIEFGYALELKLAGFNFDYLKVQFNRSTLQDDLKYQQAEEIKVRNVRDKYIMGVIDQDMMADELGYETSAETEPLVAPEILAGSKPEPQEPGTPLQSDKSAKKATRKKGKTASEKKTAGKKKAVTKNDGTEDLGEEEGED